MVICIPVNKNFMQNLSGVLLPPFQLFISVDENPIANVPPWTVERITTTCKLFCEAVYSSRYAVNYSALLVIFHRIGALTPSAAINETLRSLRLSIRFHLFIVNQVL